MICTVCEWRRYRGFGFPCEECNKRQEEEAAMVCLMLELDIPPTEVAEWTMNARRRAEVQP